MAGPNFNAQLVDPGALAPPSNIAQVPIRVGVAAAGALNQVLSFGSAADAIATLTRGHLLDCILDAFAAGEGTVKAIRVNASAEGAAEVLAGGTLVVDDTTGAPLNHARVRLVVAPGSAGLISAGGVKVRYSLDAWEIPSIQATYSEPIDVPASGEFVIPELGLTVELNPTTGPAVGAFAEINVTPGHYGAAEVAALAAVVQSPLAGYFTYLVFTGMAEDTEAGNTVANAINALSSALFAAKLPVAALAGTGIGTPSEVIEDTAASAASAPPFTSLGYSFAYVSNPRAEVGRGVVGLFEHEIAARVISQIDISTDPGRTASGPLPRVVGVAFDAGDSGDALHDARISCFRNWRPSLGGYYIQRQRLLTGPQSNFRTWPHAAVMIQALRAVTRVMAINVLRTMRKLANGTLDARDRADLRQACIDEIDRALVDVDNVEGNTGFVSAREVTVSAVTQLPAVRIRVAIRPLDYAEDLVATLEYSDQI